MAHKCTTCNKVASHKCIECNVPFCNVPCQRTHHLYYSLCGVGVKRERDDDENTVDLIYL